MRNYSIYIGLLIGLILLFSCRKDDDIIGSSSANINLSTDSISFDTVFTTVGSVTKNFRIFNPFKESIKISSIRLRNGSNSQFRINIDGVPGNQSDIIIPPKDSIFGFVEVTVDPNDQLNPFFIEDEIVFFTNGNEKTLKLLAYGQNATYFIPDSRIEGLPAFSIIANEFENVTFTKDKPYVIYGYAVVDSNATLNIDAGARIYFHNNGGLWVYRGGNIQVNGTQADPVLFRGSRLDRDYDDIAGQWDRIWINEGSVNNSINYAIIENAFIGIQAEPFPSSSPQVANNQLNIRNTIIRNASGFGLLGTLYNINGENLLIENCGQYNVAMTGSGNYDFKHCTFANYWNESERETPLFYAQNYQSTSVGLVVGNPRVRVANSIIDGRLDIEWDFDAIDTTLVDFQFENCIIKTDSNLTGGRYINSIPTPTLPLFTNAAERDYTLIQGSTAINFGSVGVGQLVPTDLEGNARTMDTAPDAGCYEFQ